MGVLQRFERRLGGLVEGAFAKVFKGGVEPVEIAGALARETDDRRAISSNRVLVPNEFGVELAGGDFARLAPYQRPLCDELASMVSEHAAEQRYTFVGPVTVHLSEADDLDVGVFRVRSSVASADPAVVSGRRSMSPRSSPPGVPRLVISSKAGGLSSGDDREYLLDAETTIIGRSEDCDIRLNDTGVSRRHGEVQRTSDGQFLYVDAGSTNGSIVNGRPAKQVKLVNGDRIELGGIILTFRREDGRGIDPSADRGRAAGQPGLPPESARASRQGGGGRGAAPEDCGAQRRDRYGGGYSGRDRERERDRRGAGSGYPAEQYPTGPRHDGPGRENPRHDERRRGEAEPYRVRPRDGAGERDVRPRSDPYPMRTNPPPPARGPEPGPRGGEERAGRGSRAGADPYGGYGGRGFGGSAPDAGRGGREDSRRGGPPGRRADRPGSGPGSDDLEDVYDAPTRLPGRQPPRGWDGAGERPQQGPGSDRPW